MQHENLTQQYCQAILSQKQPCKSSKTIDSEINQHLTQLLSTPQQMNNLCGFHAISSIIEFNPDKVQNLQSKQRFIKNYFMIRDFLISKMTKQKDIDEMRNYGEMHRVQIDMIMERKEEVEGLKGKNIADFTFGFNYIQNSEQSLKNLQKLISQFKTHKTQTVYILLGITVHWSLLILTNPPHPHFFYIDSMNYPLKQILQNTSIPVDIDTDNYYKDLRTSLKILLDMVLRDIDLNIIKFENQLSEMLVSFAMVDLTNQKEVREWFENEYHPAVIKNDVIQPMGKCDLRRVNPMLLREFRRFVVEVCEKFKVFEVGELKERLSGY